MVRLRTKQQSKRISWVEKNKLIVYSIMQIQSNADRASKLSTDGLHYEYVDERDIRGSRWWKEKFLAKWQCRPHNPGAN